MTGTLVNAAAIAAGGCVGLLLKKGVKGSHQDSINKALGVAVLVLGLNGVISSMFTVNADGTLASSGELLLIISLVLGTLAGEALRIDDRLNGLSGLVERRLHLSGFAQSFVNGALIYCVGAMAIIGALNDGLRGDASVLYIKSLLDGISSVVLGATLGPGHLCRVACSGIPGSHFLWRVRWNRSSRVNCWGRSAAWATAWCCASASTSRHDEDQDRQYAAGAAGTCAVEFSCSRCSAGRHKARHVPSFLQMFNKTKALFRAAVFAVFAHMKCRAKIFCEYA
ncbi:MAG: DUF554 domain-containing protein [Ruthenibacterium lactatiformans]